MFSGEFWEDAKLLEELAAHREHWQKQLDRYLAIESKYFAEPNRLPRHFRLQHLALIRGIDVNRSWLEWSDALKEVINDPGDT